MERRVYAAAHPMQRMFPQKLPRERGVPVRPLWCDANVGSAPITQTGKDPMAFEERLIDDTAT